MVVKEDGTKWACQSCLKGHRVSGCNHTDRELTLVPKKGRPVTQCQHCRLERKKRSAHVKCDCGEAEKPHHPKEKCIHLREAEERAKAGFHDDHHVKQEEDPAHLVAVAEEQGCCCHHGGKCSCSLVKKEAQNKGTCPPHGPAVHKPRLESTKSDGCITVFANGHHKPVHRKNHAAHECGMPYKLPPARSHTEQNVSEAASRSVDSLTLSGSQLYSTTPFVSQVPASGFPERRLSKSEQASPKLSGMSNCTTSSSETNFSAIDFSNYGPLQTSPFVPQTTQDNMTGSYDPMSGMADGTYDPWSTLPSADSLPNNNPFGAWPTTYDTSTQPALTAASSGTQSEVDEIPAVEDLYGLPMPSIQEDVGSLIMKSNLTDGNNSNRRSLPPNFFGNADFDMANMALDWSTPESSVHGSDEGKGKVFSNAQSFPYPDTWSTPTMTSMSGIGQHPVGVTSNPGRPQSQSMGPSSAPNDDLIRQLFPDIDVSTGVPDSNPSPIGSATSDPKTMGGLPITRTNPTAMTLSTVDDTVGFISQSWNDGSLSMPNDDAFTTGYGMEQEFSNSNLQGDWPYQ